MSKSGSPLHPTDPIPALSALYQGEKTDAAVIFNTAMAMMGVAVAYLVGAIPFVQKISEGPIPGPFLLLLPIPLWLIIAFHSLITLNAMSHGVSVMIIENALFKASGLGPKVDRNMVGSAAGDKIMDIGVSRFIHKMTTLFVYGGVGIAVLLFTGYSVSSARAFVPASVIWMASAVYVLLVFMVVVSWVVGLRMIHKGRKESCDQ